MKAVGVQRIDWQLAADLRHVSVWSSWPGHEAGPVAAAVRRCVSVDSCVGASYGVHVFVPTAPTGNWQRASSPRAPRSRTRD